MTNAEKALTALVQKTIDIVDAGMFSPRDKQAILREVRGSLIEMSGLLGFSEMNDNPPPPDGRAA